MWGCPPLSLRLLRLLRLCLKQRSWLLLAACGGRAWSWLHRRPQHLSPYLQQGRQERPTVVVAVAVAVAVAAQIATGVAVAVAVAAFAGEPAWRARQRQKGTCPPCMGVAGAAGAAGAVAASRTGAGHTPGKWQQQ